MIGLFKNIFWYTIEGARTVLLYILKYVPGLQETCDEVAVWHYRPLLKTHLLLLTSGLFFIPDHLKTQEICNKEVGMEPCFLRLLLDRLKETGKLWA